MARKAYGGRGRHWHPEFEAYMDRIVDDPRYAGMPCTRDDEGKIDWIIPSNRKPGSKNWDGNARRREWWRQKAVQLGIDTVGSWLSKVARANHPTGEKPCQTCGHVMSLSYVYPTRPTVQRLNRHLPPESAIVIKAENCGDLPTIFEIARELYASSPEEALAAFGRAFPETSGAGSLEELLELLQRDYVDVQSSRLSPGAMSNCPDRLDGFHTYNKVCREIEDTGRVPENLGSYSVDRRAYQQWCEGDWAAADALMSSVTVGSCPMPGHRGGTLPVTLTAEHVGPISLGFQHSPRFSVACRICNSGKGNRMSLADVHQLIEWERTYGESVASWQAQYPWDEIKGQVTSDQEAVRLSRLMRINQHHFLTALSLVAGVGGRDALFAVLGLEFAATRYEFIGLDPATLRYDKIQTTPRQRSYTLEKQARMVRIAFDALDAYEAQGARNVQDVRSEAERAARATMEEAVAALIAKPSAFRDGLNKALAADGDAREQDITAVLSLEPDDGELSALRQAVLDAVTGYMLVVQADLLGRFSAGTHLRHAAAVSAPAASESASAAH